VAAGQALQGPVAQSLSALHAVLHAVALAQTRSPGQAAGVPATQVLLVQVLAGVNVLPAHDAPPEQSALVLHCTQPAVASQSGADPEQVCGVPATQVLLMQVLAGVKVVPLHEAAAHWTVLQSSIPPQPSEIVPQVAPCAAQVVGVQPHTIGFPPPPQVWGSVQSASLVQPHAPCASQRRGAAVVPPHTTPVWMACAGEPFEHVFVMQVVEGSTSVSSATDMTPPLPSHSSCWQSPAFCGGAVVVGVPAAVFVVVQVPLAQVGCSQSLSTPGQSLS
jgi:hypothetical protein